MPEKVSFVIKDKSAYIVLPDGTESENLLSIMEAFYYVRAAYQEGKISSEQQLLLENQIYTQALRFPFETPIEVPLVIQ